MPKFLIVISAVLVLVPDATSTSENARGHPKRLPQGTSSTTGTTQFQPNRFPITTGTDPPLPSLTLTPEVPSAPVSSMPTRRSHIDPSNPVANNPSQLPVSVPSFPSSAKPYQKPELGPSVPSSSYVSPTMIKPISLEPVTKPVSSRPVTLPPYSPIQPATPPRLHPTMPQPVVVPPSSSTPIQPATPPPLHPTMPQPVVVPPSSTSHQPITPPVLHPTTSQPVVVPPSSSSHQPIMPPVLHPTTSQPVVVPPSSSSHQPIMPPALHPTTSQPVVVPPSSSSHQPIMPITNKPVISPAPHSTTPSNSGGDHGTPVLKGFTVFFFISLLVYGAYLGYVNRSTLLFIIGRMCADFIFKTRRFIGQVKMRLHTLRRNAERPPSLNEILFDDSTQAELSTRLLPNDDASQ